MKTNIKLSVIISSVYSLLLLFFLLTSCSNNEYKVIDDIAISNEDEESDWLAYGRTHSETRFSPIDQINVENANKLKADWYMDLPGDVGLVSTPLVVDGVMYFTGTMNIVRAVNAVTGDLIWKFDPEVGKAIRGKRQAGWIHNRGLSFYEGKVFGATWDGRLFALDAESGIKIWMVETFDPKRPLYITGAPKAFKGKVLIGNGGAEAGPSRGFVTAFDAETGKEAWKFYIVPGDPKKGFENEAMEMASETWKGEWWKHGGGGNAWHGFTYDPDFDVLYIGTGNGSPWNQKIRSPGGGDNLFLCSIVALNPDTGKYLWHYQTTPGESWDYNSTQDIVLADLTINNEKIKAILHAPKNGFFYVINRANGKLISAKPFVETSWASHIDLNTGRPVEAENIRYEKGPAYITPGANGGHIWQAMSYNPKTGLVYIPALHEGFVYSDHTIDIEKWQSVDFRGGTGVRLYPPENPPGDYPSRKPPRDYPASLIAWDPIKQEEAWSIPQNKFWNGGTLTTAGNLVFQGRSDGMLLAYNAENGDIVWEFDAGLGISAPPITYKIDGKQYISVLVGWGGVYAGVGGKDAYDMGWSYGVHTRRLITFSLEGKVNVPTQPKPFFPKPLSFPSFIVDENRATKGAKLYYGYACSACHGGSGISGGMAPDLRASPICIDSVAFKSVVKDGIKLDKGMPNFEKLTDENMLDLMHFIRYLADNSIITDSKTTE
jgi:quinohemoprotein ethanol dehydrogenase